MRIALLEDDRQEAEQFQTRSAGQRGDGGIGYDAVFQRPEELFAAGAVRPLRFAHNHIYAARQQPRKYSAERAVTYGIADAQPEVHGNKRARHNEAECGGCQEENDRLPHRERAQAVVYGGALKVVLGQLISQGFVMDEVDKHPAEHKEQPDKEADQALRGGAAYEQRNNERDDLQPRAHPARDRRRVL